VVAISLQAKEQAFGVLLLGTPRQPALHPGREVGGYSSLSAIKLGMAVENSYLIQQTSRAIGKSFHVII